jgi:hypothetical protein
MIVRYTKDADGIDELVATRARVHLERLNERDWMLIVESNKQRIHLTVGRVHEWETENIEAAWSIENKSGGKR